MSEEQVSAFKQAKSASLPSATAAADAEVSAGEFTLQIDARQRTEKLVGFSCLLRAERCIEIIEAG